MRVFRYGDGRQVERWLYPDDASPWNRSSMTEQAKRNMKVDDIIANDAHRNALRLSATASAWWGIAYPADPMGIRRGRELRV